jgi:5-methylcytosine-specific restriction endonuclease McrA
MIKFCKKCQIETERYESGGHCKICRAKYRDANREKAKQHYKNNFETYAKKQKDYKQKNLEKIKARNIQHRKDNIEKFKIKDATYYEKNKNKIKESQSIYYEKHKKEFLIRNHNRRVKQIGNGGVLSKGIEKQLFALQKGKCPCCKKNLDNKFHLDHIVPIALGGTNTDDNVQLLHAGCNLKKKAKHPIDFMQSLGFLL